MTREKAIRILNVMYNYYTDDCVDSYYSFDEEEEKALGMAIKELEQGSVLGKIKAEIEQIEINGHIRDVECFRAGINTALNIINKYIESEKV